MATVAPNTRSSSIRAEALTTPCLDVLLVLLILFMYLCLNQQKVIPAQLPDTNVRAIDTTPGIVLEVMPNETYAINTHRVTGAATYQDVVTAMDIARGAGVVAIGLTKAR